MRTAMLSAALFVIAAGVWASEPAPAPAHEGEEHHKAAAEQTDKTPKSDMMMSCKERCKEKEEAVAALDKAVQDALASNDAAKMKDALTQTHKFVTDLKDDMATCKEMMNMMEMMHGMMSKMHGGMMDHKADSKDGAAKDSDAKDPHAGHH